MLILQLIPLHFSYLLFMHMLQNVDLHPGLEGMGKMATLKLVDWIVESTSPHRELISSSSLRRSSGMSLKAAGATNSSAATS
jgi:hypothetical protein